MLRSARSTSHAKSLAVALALPLLLVAIFLLVNQERDTGLDALRSRPEADLAFPASELIAAGGQDTRQTIDGSQPAETWKRYGSSEAVPAIRSFFEHAVASAAWESAGGLAASMTQFETQVCAWHIGETYLRLAFYDEAIWGASHPDEAHYSTVYEVALLVAHTPARDTPCTGLR